MKRLLNNTTWILINQIFQLAVSFFVGIATVRYLGPSNYGEITYISSYVSFFSNFCALGLDTVVINRLVVYQDRDGEVIQSAIFLRFIAGLISVASVTLMIHFIDHDQELVMIAALMSLKLIFYAFNTVEYWYQYKLMSKKTAIADMIAFTIASLYRVYILATGKSIYWFACYETLLYFVNAFFYVPMFRKDCSHPIHISKDLCLDLLHSCIPYLIAGLMLALYSQIDRIMIKQILNSTEEVGYYSVAATLCNLISFIPESISLSARPVLMQMKREKAQTYDLRVTQVLASIIWFSLVYSVLLTAFAAPVIRILYGDSYLPSVPALRILVWSSLFSHLTKIRDMWLLGEDQSRFVTFLSAIGTLMNVVLNAIMIPRLGMSGAAIATLLTQGILTLVVPACFSQTRGFAIDALHAITLHGVQIHDLLNEIRDALPGMSRKGNKDESEN